jgi:two-component system sensor histidine kinase AlgZ
MHPILTSGRYFLLYLAAWIPLGGMFGLVLSLSGRLTWREALFITVPLTIVLAFECLSPFYMCRAMPLGTRMWRTVANHTVTALGVTGIILILAHALTAHSTGLFPGLDQRANAGISVVAVMAILLYLLSVGLHYAVLAVASSRKAEVLTRDAQLKALKAQVNPHFLFNSLNSISALTSVDPTRAREMCIYLSDFLRTSLRLGERPSISFSEELELTRNYLQVEQVRFGSRLKVVEDIDAACHDCEVPPLIVQPLVENAIKHGIATLIEGGEISISGRRSRTAMRFVVENPFDPESPVAKKTGIGLRNVRDRLQTRFGEAARLEITIEENRYRVAVSIPCASGEAR